MVDAGKLVGSSTLKTMASVVLKGNAYQRGVQYGQRFEKELDAFYYWFVQKEPRQVMTEEYLAVLRQMEQSASLHFPQLLEEIKGWSDGSGLDYDKCRLMAFHNGIRYVLTPGCANVIVTDGPDGPWLAKNQDVFENERSWQVLKIAHCDEGLSYMGGFYVGLPECSAGINSAGLAVGGSSLPACPPEEKKGLPNLSYCLLCTQPTVADACRLVQKHGFLGKGVHMALLDAGGDAAAVEAGGGNCHIRRPDERGFLVVTNNSATGLTPPHPLTPKAYLDNSRARYDRLTDIMNRSNLNDRTVDFAQQILADHQGDDTICQHIPNGFHTVSGFVLRPGRGNPQMQFCWGYPCQGSFLTYSFS